MKNKPRKADAYSRRSLEKAARASMEAKKQQTEKDRQQNGAAAAEEAHNKKFPKA